MAASIASQTDPSAEEYKDRVAFALCALLCLYTPLRPTFVAVSNAVARLSDLTAIAALLLVVIIAVGRSHKVPSSFLAKAALWSLLFECVVLLALVGQGLHGGYGYVPADFTDIMRPVVMVSALAAGYFMTYRFVSLPTIERGMIGLALIAVMMALVEKNLPSLGGIIFKVYSTNNTAEGFGTGRPAAMFYLFTELATFLVTTGIIVANSAYRRKSKIGKAGLIVAGLVIMALSVVSTSRSGLVFLILAIAWFVAADLVENFSYKKLAVYIGSGLLFCTAIVVFVVSHPVYLSTVKMLFALASHLDLESAAKLGSRSIGNRAQQLLTVAQIWSQWDYRIIMGNGPLRAIERSHGYYVEMEWIKLVFRYGLIGWGVYYLFYLYPLFAKGKGIVDHELRTLRALCVAYFLADIFSDVSEQIKSSMVFCFWAGSIFGWRDRALLFGNAFRQAAANRGNETLNIGKDGQTA